MVVVSLFPYLKADWGLSDTQCGMLASAIYWAILVFSLPVSLLIDRWSRKKGIAIMATLWSLATAACAFTRSLGQLLAAKALIGVGEAGYAPGGTSMLAAVFPEARRAQIMGFWNASIPLGSALGIILGGVIAEHWGWRHAFGLVALPGLLVALLFLTVRDTPTVALLNCAEVGRSGERMGWRGVLRHLLGQRSLWLTYLGFAGNQFVTSALMTWLPSYYQRQENVPMSQASLKGGAVMLMAIIGAPLGGWLTDRWRRRRSNARLVFGALTSSLAAALLLFSFGVLEGTAQYVGLLAAGVAAVAFVPGAAAVTQDVVHPGVRATAYSLCVISMHLLGSAIGPVSVGAVSDRLGLHAALTLLPCTMLVAALAFALGARFYDRDVRWVATMLGTPAKGVETAP
jgi:MFS family permease